MDIYKLKSHHSNKILPLFKNNRFMGVNAEKENFLPPDFDFSETYHNLFCATYLSDLENYHAYAVEVNGSIQGLLGFYESIDDASWYWNLIRTFGSGGGTIKPLLDKVIEHNELNGRFKFYSMFPTKYANVYRRLAFSNMAKERYDSFDEYYVDAKHQCKFTLAWQILYRRTLVPTDTVVRCTFLKQKYRNQLYNAGRL